MLSNSEVRSDIAAFALSGSAVEMREEGPSRVRYRWKSRTGASKQALLVVSNDSQEAVIEIDDATLTYSQFLASDHMADLDTLATRTLAMVSRFDDYTPLFAVEVDGDEMVESEPQEAVELLLSALDKPAVDPWEDQRLATDVLFVRGEAGAGKSVVLRRLARRLAQEWSDGDKRRPLALYIDAQGKALQNLDDAMSSVRDDLDVVSIPKNAVGVLCKRGLLVPVVDGFDELLGVGGAGDAFNSLARFLSRLDGKGAVIASGRKTFYSKEEMQITAARHSDASYLTRVVEVRPWTREGAMKCLKHTWRDSARKQELCDRAEELLSDSAVSDLMCKPFFANHVATEMLRSDLTSGKPLVEQLASSMISREVEKWVDFNGMSVFTAEDHVGFLRQVAWEMWWSGCRELDVDTIRVIVGDMCEGRPADHRAIVSERAFSHAMFSTDERDKKRGRVVFQHQLFFDYFLAVEFLESLRRNEVGSLQSSLSDATVNESLLDVLAQMCQFEESAAVVDLVNCLGGTLPDGDRHYVVRLNAGAMCVAMMSRCIGPLVGVGIRNAVFNNVSLERPVLEGPCFERCDFCDVSMCGLRVRDGRMIQCTVRSMRVCGSGEFGFDFDADSRVMCVIDRDGRRYFSSQDVADRLTQAGASVAWVNRTELTVVQRDRRRALDRFLGKMERRKQCSSDDLRDWGIERCEGWDEVFCALRDSGVLVRRVIARRGTDNELMSLAFPTSQIREGDGVISSNLAIRRMWEIIDG